MDADFYDYAEVIETDISLLCRICANTSDDPLMEIYEENGVENDIATKIESYLPIKVSQEDILPVKICVNCANGILTFHQLYVNCLDADYRFKNMLAEEQLIVEGVSNEKNLLEVTDIDNNEQTHDTYLSDDDIKMSNEITENLDSVDDNSINAVSEIFEEQETKIVKTEQFTSAEETHHSTCNSLIDDNNSTEFGSKLEYLDRIKSTNNEETKNIPISVLYTIYKSGGRFFCPKCQVLFQNKEEFCAHLINSHQNDLSLLEAVCRKPLKTDNKMLKDAKFVMNGKQSYKCADCDKWFSTSHVFKNHRRIHTGEKPYMCWFCHKTFRIYTSVIRHIQSTHLQIKKFVCEICNQKFAHNINLKEHQRLHSNERTYVCDICGKSFRQKASLFLHNRTHQNVFPFTCSYCNKGFRTKTAMLLHVAIHTGEKNNECEICNKKFRRKNDLKVHKSLHSNNKPFKCAECNLTFKLKRYLTRHLSKYNHRTS